MDGLSNSLAQSKTKVEAEVKKAKEQQALAAKKQQAQEEAAWEKAHQPKPTFDWEQADIDWV